MADITLSKAVRSNLLNLQSTATQLGKTQERLATGLKVNSALDNPTNFFTASSLNSRAGDLGNLLDSISNATQTIEAADNGITAITKLVESAQAAARQAKQVSATVDSTTVSAQATATGNVAIPADTTATVTGSTTFTDDTEATIAGSTVNSIAGTTTLDGLSITNGSTFTVSDGTDSVTIYLYDSNASGTASGAGGSTVDINLYGGSAYNTVSDLVGAINTAMTNNNVDATFTFTPAGSDGVFDFTADNTTASVSLTAGATDGLAYFGLGTSSATATSSALAALSSSITFTTTAGTDTLDLSTVSSTSELSSALSGFSNSGLTFALTGGQVVVTAPDNSTSFTVGGSGTDIGITAQDYDPTNATVAGLSGTLTIATSSGTDTLTFGAGDIQNRTDFEAALAGLANSGVTASINGSNFLTFTGANGEAVTIGGTLDADTDFGIAEQEYTATSSTTQIANPARAEFVTQYNNLMSQIDDLVTDASFNGVNLLNGDTLQVQFNEDGSSKLDITGVTFDSAGLGLSAVASGGFDTNTAIDAVLDTLGTAVNSLRSQASTFGSNLSVVEIRNDFTKEMINTLETGASNLTLADSNEEAANLLALQTRQQLSSTALSLASQSDQNVLRLF